MALQNTELIVLWSGQALYLGVPEVLLWQTNVTKLSNQSPLQSIYCSEWLLDIARDET